MQAFVPKNRRPKFDLELKIIDLNNIPLTSGASYTKWHLPSSTSAEHRGRTPKSLIKEHKVVWDYDKVIPVRLVIDKNGALQDTEIHFEVIQEYGSGSRERIVLGSVRLNLAEYCWGSNDGAAEGEGGEGGVTRRYLMQDSKINSTLKVSIWMRQADGDRTFTSPPLKTARVFGGIAGIMTAEQGEPDDLGHVPSMSSKTREIGELQDMYRRTLAASWTAQHGELPADQCIEDIFAGGDGWGRLRPGVSALGSGLTSTGHRLGDTEDVDSEGEAGQAHGRHRRTYSSLSATKQRGQTRSGGKGLKTPDVSHQGDSGGSGTQTQSSSADENRRALHRARESDESEIREDMRSWHVAVL